jgi:hypothetical protein
MGFVIWYQVVVPGAGATGLLPLRVSNDVFSGDYIVDADITVDLAAGPTVGMFCVALANLPVEVADALRSRHKEALRRGQRLEATISLGYFDAPAGRREPVLNGVITHIRGSVRDDGSLVTELRGYDQAGHRLRETAVHAHRPGRASLDLFVADIAKAAGVGLRGGGLPEVSDYTLRARTGLQALRLIADRTRSPLVISDGTIRIGATVGAQSSSVTFSAEDNIVAMDPRQEDDDDPVPGLAGGTGERTSLELLVLGDPALRAGQPVRLRLKDPRDALPGSLRTEQVRHHFSTSSGYTCQVTVVAAEPGRRVRRPSGVQRLAERLRDSAEAVGEDRPAVDVGEVDSYQPGGSGGHRATLRYGQSALADAVAPSVEVAVDEAPLLHNKPMASPFAFHNCGLMVPVLPGMRALLAHNRGLVNDAVVSGFVWAEEPRLDRPKNQPGDWWLCLPTELDSDGLPTGKAVNDLTDSAGQRVIQAKGLKISVGEQALPPVGDRPEVPADLPGSLVIEHESRTTVTVASDGAVTIATSGKDITFTNGSASITLTGDSVRLHGANVEVQ